MSTDDGLARAASLRWAAGHSWEVPTVVPLNGILEQPRRQVAPWVHGDNLLWVPPLRKRSDTRSRLGIGEVGSRVNALVGENAGLRYSNLTYLCSRLS